MTEIQRLEEIECDRHNIQEMIDRMPLADSKGEYRAITSAIKILVKEIRHQKHSLSHDLYHKTRMTHLPLFEVEYPEIEHNLHDLSSFFGEID